MQEIKITYAEGQKKGASLKVIGVGGAGGNAINRMIEEGLKGVEFIAANTDIQDLHSIKDPALTIQIGEKLTRGLGAGSNSEIGMQAALENTDEIINFLEGADMVFVTAGMGGGTGTGASQVIANHASSLGILTVGVVTKPFEFEGNSRMSVAEDGIKGLMESVDAMITIPNEKLFEIEGDDLTIDDAFKKVDEILLKAVRGISDIINNHGQHNVDFADVKAVMSEKGMTLMGTGESKGENRAEEAARKALSSPLLDNMSINGATGVLYNITASSVGLKELRTVAGIITSSVAPDVKAKFGIVKDENMKDQLRVTVIATGFKEDPRTQRSMNEHVAQGYSSPQPQKAVINRTFDTDPMKQAARQNTDSYENVSAAPAPAASAEPVAQPSYSNPARAATPREELPFTLENTRDSIDIRGYLNDSSMPSMMTDADKYDDIWDVPAFQRPKVTEKK